MNLRKQINQQCQNLNFKYLSLNFNQNLNVLKKIKTKLNYPPRIFEFLIQDEKTRANFLLLLNSIDFSLWCYPLNWKYKNEKSYFGLAKRFYDFFMQFGLNQVNFKDFQKIISPKENKKLAALRYKIYVNTLSWLNKNYNGNFLLFIK
ncbi:MAG: hypothetical protein ACPL3E_00430, partial [Minisyncoccia bacterium]